ncbi:MAG: hypothetical protein AABZ57_02935, partial [Candidatus Margulisiibacteriota bacterium]
MLKKYGMVVLILFAFVAFSPVYAAGISKLIDNFENNTDLMNPEWWVFDRVTRTVVKNPVMRPGDPTAKSCGRRVWCLIKPTL